MNYGIEWIQFNKAGQMVNKQKFFKTSEALAKFAEKLPEKVDLFRINAYANPVGVISMAQWNAR